jgi:aryl-alcohol dehydrogenase-like predicted oxidoreductase
MYQKRYADQWMYDAAIKFTQLAADSGHHPVSLAVAWVTHHPAVTAPIIGARNASQVRDSLGSADIKLSSELYDTICGLTPTPPLATDRSESQFRQDNA